MTYITGPISILFGSLTAIQTGICTLMLGLGHNADWGPLPYTKLDCARVQNILYISDWGLGACTQKTYYNCAFFKAGGRLLQDELKFPAAK